MRNKIKNTKGFTLLEMTISLGIFIILFTLTLGIYSYTLKAEQRTIQISRLQSEAQLISEIMAKKIRNSKVDYNYSGYGGTINSSGTLDSEDGETTLALIDKTGEPTIFRFSPATTEDNSSIEVCIDSCTNDESYNAIPAGDVSIVDLKFFVYPATNPFSLTAAPETYPKVSIVMTLENTIGGNTRNLIVQQTIPQRIAGY